MSPKLIAALNKQANQELHAAQAYLAAAGRMAIGTDSNVLVDVAQASEAERAGLAAGDVLLQVDGVAVHTMAETRGKLAGPLGDDVVVKFRRGEETDSVRVAREPVRK